MHIGRCNLYIIHLRVARSQGPHPNAMRSECNWLRGCGDRPIDVMEEGGRESAEWEPETVPSLSPFALLCFRASQNSRDTCVFFYIRS